MKVLKNRYQFSMDDVLGKGAYGVVLKGTDLQTGRTIAIKTISISQLSPKEEQMIQQEVALMKTLVAPNIVQFLDSVQEASTVYIM